MAWTDNLTGEQRNAVEALNALFTQYGIATLAPKIADYVRQGYTAETIALLIQETAEFKQRFSANDARRAAGLPVLSPAEYLATEQQYRSIMTNAGLPEGFYDSPDDFKDFLTKDISAAELKTRVDAAAGFVNSTDPVYRAAVRSVTGLSDGDITAWYLDAKKATPLIEKTIAAADVSAAAHRSGLDLAAERARYLADLGVNAQAATAGFGQIAEQMSGLMKLGSISGEGINQTEVEDAYFAGNGAAQQKIARLKSQERARFSGTGAVGKSTLSRGSDIGNY